VYGKNTVEKEQYRWLSSGALGSIVFPDQGKEVALKKIRKNTCIKNE
jgi:hypothetical protein